MFYMKVKIKKLHPNAVIPKYAKEGDAGLDLVATSVYEDSDDRITYGTGVAIEIPEGYLGLLMPRSSARDYELILSNSVGLIDSGYRGEAMATFRKTKGIFSRRPYCSISCATISIYFF
jgi:dUTP pyrophosphatase